MVIHKVDTLFLDMGGVLLNDGWGIDSRQKAVKKFKRNAEEMNIRHEKCWDVLESGKMTMDHYLDEVIFYQSQSFSKSEFLNFIFSQSISLNGAFEYFIRLKKANGLRIFALNNEAR